LINNSFENLATATGGSNWAKIIWVGIIFAQFMDCYDVCNKWMVTTMIMQH